MLPLSLPLLDGTELQIDEQEWSPHASALMTSHAKYTYMLTYSKHQDGRALVYGKVQEDGAPTIARGALVADDGEIENALTVVAGSLHLKKWLLDSCLEDIRKLKR